MRHPRLLLFSSCVLGACAMAEPANRYTLNAMDAHLAPSSNGARWAALPLTLPAGVVGLAADALVVHPIRVLDDAWGDTVEYLWRPREESRFRRAVMAPVRGLATPLVFVGDWLTRAVFAVPPRREASQEADA
ncbi:MAG: hypothetical protein R3F56_09985 [Planctomycetota bacterium]